MPIPENELKCQVCDDSHPIEKIKSKPHFCIEHVFWEPLQKSGYYIKKEFHVYETIHFKKDKKNKVKFAKEVIPKLDAACFEVFRPMFDFIRSHC